MIESDVSNADQFALLLRLTYLKISDIVLSV